MDGFFAIFIGFYWLDAILRMDFHVFFWKCLEPVEFLKDMQRLIIAASRFLR